MTPRTISENGNGTHQFDVRYYNKTQKSVRIKNKGNALMDFFSIDSRINSSHRVDGNIPVRSFRGMRECFYRRDSFDDTFPSETSTERIFLSP